MKTEDIPGTHWYRIGFKRFRNHQYEGYSVHYVRAYTAADAITQFNSTSRGLVDESYSIDSIGPASPEELRAAGIE